MKVARALAAALPAVMLLAAWPPALLPADGLVADIYASKIVAPSARELLALLRRGGNTIYFRHAATTGFEDESKIDFGDCGSQRNLSEHGRAQARAIGAAFLRLKIPVGEVLASPFCRTAETARLAFGRVTKSWDLYSRAQPLTAQDMARNELLRKRFALRPHGGVNDILVSHGSPLQVVAGELLREGEAAVVRPSGTGSFRVVARMAPEAWEKLQTR